MRTVIASLLFAFAGIAQASFIPMIEFPLKNGPNRDDIYKMSEHPNTVFVFEAYRLSCEYCNENAPLVDALADDYRANARVQVLDLGQDVADRDYEEWIDRHHPNHSVVLDTNKRVYNTLKTVNGVPQVFVVNCRGELVGNIVGSWDANDERKVRKLVDQALVTTCEK